MRSLVPVVAAGVVPLAVLILIIVGSSLSLVQWRPPEIWSTDFGTPTSDNGITAVAADSTGLYATGYAGYSNLNVTPSYLFVSRYGVDGEHIWTQTFGNPNSYFISQSNAIGLGGGALYVAGELNDTSFLRKYDLNGSQLWNSLIGSGRTNAVAVSVLTSNVYVVYYLGSNSFLRDYDPSGNVLWTDLVGNYTDSLSVYANPSAVYVLNVESSYTPFIRKYDLNGTLVWTRICACAVQGSDEVSGDSTGIYVLGEVQNGVQAFLGRYDLKGNNAWAITFSAPDNSVNVEQDVFADSSGAYLTLITGEAHAFLMKYSVDGSMSWAFQTQARGSPQGSGLIPGIPVAIGQNSVFEGGSLVKSSNTRNAYLARFSQSSSLIFFGQNPPWSFIIVGILVAAVVSSIFLMRKLQRKVARPGRPRPVPRNPPAAD
jgi:hypothetical protein